MPFASDSKPFIGINAKNICLISRFCARAHARLPWDGFLEFRRSGERLVAHPALELFAPYATSGSPGRAPLAARRAAMSDWMPERPARVFRCRAAIPPSASTVPVVWSDIAASRDYLAGLRPAQVDGAPIQVALPSR
jgi:hypothetical protein